MIRPLLLLSILFGFFHAATAKLYVSPRGAASAAGTLSDPLTLGAALATARTDLSVDEIILLEGTYAVVETVQVHALARPVNAPLTIRSESADRPAVISGGQSLRGLWKSPSSGDAIVARMPLAARSAVRVVDLKAAGISDFGTFRKRGFDGRHTAPGELFIGGQRQTVAGYPNVGQWKGTPSDPTGIEDGYQRYQRYSGWEVELPSDIASRWKNVKLTGAWVHGYFGTDWADAHLPVRGVNVAANRLILGASPAMGIRSNGAYRVYNVVEELDSAGEWYLDRSSAKLYYWPTSAGLSSSAFSLLEGPVLQVSHSQNVHFKNLVFEVSRGDLVNVNASTGIVFRQSEFRGAGIKGLVLDGEHNRVEKSLFWGIADTSIHMTGGDRDNLRPGANLAVNNVIRDYGEVYFSYSTGIYINGVGNAAAHNLIHDAPHEGIQVNGALNRIYRNEIFDVCQYTDDAGAIYSGRDFVGWGNEIVENYVHDIRTHRADHDWVHAVYLDDFASGFTVRGNIFENIEGFALDSGGGRYNVIDANIILNAGGGHINDNRGAKWIVTTPGDSWNMYEKISAVARKSNPWKATFPGLAMIPNDLLGAMNYVYPDGCQFTRNAGDGVAQWTHEQDWTSRDAGVFRHYKNFDGKQYLASVSADENLADQSNRSDIQLYKDSLIVPFSRMGLQDNTWADARSTNTSAVANLTWNGGDIFAGSALTFSSMNSWSKDGDPIVWHNWRINGATVGSQADLHWTPPSAGNYTVTLELATSVGHRDTVEYRFVAKSSGARPSTWLGAPQQIPGIVEVEYFDHGRYFDTRAGNSGGALRNTDVDIGKYAGDYYIGWTQPGEWFELSVSAQAATYDVFVRAASRINDMGIAFRWDGQLAGGIILPNVGNNTAFGRHYAGRVNVPAAGRHTLRLDLLGKDFNVDHVEFVKVGAPILPEPEPAPAPAPEPEAQPEPEPQPQPEPDLSGSLAVAYYHDVRGSTIADLEASSIYPHRPSELTAADSFELPKTSLENFGVRVSGWLMPQSSGTYEFFIASDDHGSLRLSTDATIDNARQIASVPGHTAAHEYTKFPEQKSAGIQLQAGKAYYIEAVMKQGWSGTNLSVAWRGPGVDLEIIPASVLSPSAPAVTPALELGSVAIARYDAINGSALANLYAAEKFPGSPDSTKEFSSFEYLGSGDNFGLYAWAWLVPETTGDYTFWIASDDEGELRLSNNGDTSNAKTIAKVSPHSPARDYDRHASQKSASVRLEAGKAYYIEALMKQGWSGANLSVAWQGPGFSREIIPGRVLGLPIAPGSEPSPDPESPAVVLTGDANLAHFRDLTGSLLDDLYGSEKFPEEPDTVEQITRLSISGSAYNYGLFSWGWIVPETSGDYTFWIASDDQGELMLSPDASEIGAKRIASVPRYSGHEEFDRFAEQRSQTVRLEAGQAYYFAAAMKQGWGSGHLAVAWQGPDFEREILPGRVLNAEMPAFAEASLYEVGRAAFARYDNISGSKIADLEADPKFPAQPDATSLLGQFEFDGSGDNFGILAWAWLIPEASGFYRFWLASDDQGELRLSKNASMDQPTLIASVSTHSGARQYDKMASQRSAEIYLEAGSVYYIEALMKQGWSAANLSVAWEGPGFTREIIPGRVLGLPAGNEGPLSAD